MTQFEIERYLVSKGTSAWFVLNLNMKDINIKVCNYCSTFHAWMILLWKYNISPLGLPKI